MGYSLGVDLGTTFTAAATALDGTPLMLELGNRAAQIPSVVYLHADGSVLVGEAAERRGATDPGRLVREFKRRIGDHVPILVEGTPYSPQALTARVLRWVLDRATERLGEAPARVTLTHPANWGAFKVDLLQQAAALADLTDVRLCSEPEAAAVQYASHAQVADGESIAVYDLGGGTFDVCVLQKTADGFGLLGSPEGIEHLGGIDFDEAVFRRVLDAAGLDLTGEDPDSVQLLAGVARLRRDCVEAKEALSADVDADIAVTLGGRTSHVRLTRGEFEDLIRPALEETVAATRRALRSAGLADKGVSTFVLVGGSSRIPLVSELLYEAFRCPAALDTHPKHDIALGAARTGSGAAQPGSRPARRPRLPRRTTASGPARRPKRPRRPRRTRSPDTGRSRRPVVGTTRTAAVAGLVVLVTGGLLAFAGDSQGVGANTNDLPQSARLPDTQLVDPRDVDGNVDLYLVDATTGTFGARLTTDPDQDRGASLSPDRRTIIYAHITPAGSDLRVMAADGSGDRPLLAHRSAGCEQMSRPSWDPVYPQLLGVVCTDSTGRESLRIVRVDGIPTRTLDTGDLYVADPAFSPDGTVLTYWATETADASAGILYSVAADGSSPSVALTDGSDGLDGAPVWAPDGSRIAFNRRSQTETGGNNSDILVIDPDGSDPITLTPGTPQDLYPSWSPDGSQIVFTSRRIRETGDATRRLWVMDADGTNLHPLVPDDSGGDAFAPVWTGR